MLAEEKMLEESARPGGCVCPSSGTRLVGRVKQWLQVRRELTQQGLVWAPAGLLTCFATAKGQELLRSTGVRVRFKQSGSYRRSSEALNEIQFVHYRKGQTSRMPLNDANRLRLAVGPDHLEIEGWF